MEEKTRTMIKDGLIYQCPNCGEMLNSFASVCPACNYELRGSKVSSCVHELSQKLAQTSTPADKQELISNFYIPNTKEDILEFFILAYSQIVAGGDDVEAWAVKFEQAFIKAKLTFGKTEEYEYINELYNSVKILSKKRKTKVDRISIMLFAVGLTISSASLLAYEILYENGYYMYEACYAIAAMGAVCFLMGLVKMVFLDKQKK